jgi:pullulanase
VILDVVFNHTSAGCSLQTLAPDYYYRRMPNGSLANGSGCGNEVRSEAPMMRRLIIDSLKYWVKEYGVDGFRFDLMALIDQETIRRANRELRVINPDIVMYGEPWTGGVSPLREKSDKTVIKQLPAGAFNDDFRNALKGQPDGSEPGWIEDGSQRDELKRAMLVSPWFGSPGQSINYMTCHDNMVLWDKLEDSMPQANEALRVETMKLGYLALLTSQGVPFIHGGEEFGRSKGGDNNSYNSPDSVNEVDWELKQQHHDLFTYVRDVIALRKAHPVFRLRTRAQVESRMKFDEAAEQGTLVYTVSGAGVPGETWSRVCVVLNSANEGGTEVTLPGGEWSVAMDENGAAAERTVSGKVNVRYKSGLVLYQR